ncbi:gamma-glutamyltransferase family protein [Sabulicella glaciei]|uniref:Gamma-glutamyltransferase n=1 Tax=Sabulicella glaciei TaxID=2984948 RepID=A0ABT3P0L1_9PROT|nr:gamma-glutamyltransferase [Roseococcus sp. MDT2-1-1]MCW8087339.1 gamma-glutamyltransferase [Roseococcus sp. MDT2-1-1]
MTPASPGTEHSGVGMVASAHPRASQAGCEILEAGGNAFDAAVAVAAALNVVEPYMSGLAGMGFATMWVAAESRVRVLDFVPPIPHSFPAGRFTSREELLSGPAAVASPGNLAGWCALHEAYGRLPLRHAIAPAMALAEEGFEFSAFGIEEVTGFGPGHAAAAGTGEAFAAAFPFHTTLRAGDQVRLPMLGATLRQVAECGADVLYRGEIGAGIVAFLAEHGGTLTHDDLAAVSPVWREPISVPYRGLRIHVPPPPCEGFQFLLTLRLLEGFDLRLLEPLSVDHLDLVIRAVRMAAAVRIANNTPDEEQLRVILSEANVQSLRDRLRAGDGLQGPTEQWTSEPPPGADPGHTTSFSVADREGNLVCITQSLGSVFGSGVVVPGTGVVLNNFLYWADVQPGSPNRAKPGQPLAMCMSPSIATKDGEPCLALGTPGSYGILQTQAQAFVSHLDFGLGLQAAIDAPRARLWDGRLVEIENRVAPEALAGLRAKGHDARFFPAPFTMRVGGMQAVGRDPRSGRLCGAADPRRNGAVVVTR